MGSGFRVGGGGGFRGLGFRMTVSQVLGAGLNPKPQAPVLDSVLRVYHQESKTQFIGYSFKTTTRMAKKLVTTTV